MAKRRAAPRKKFTETNEQTMKRQVIRGDKQDNRLDILKVKPIAAWPYPRICLHILMERAISFGDKVIYPWLMMAQAGVHIMEMPYIRTDLARNQSAINLLKSDFTHHLMIDADHVHPYDLVERLAKWVILDPDVWVVGGLNFRRGAPYEPCAFVYGEDKRIYSPAAFPPGIMEVDSLVHI